MQELNMQETNEVSGGRGLPGGWGAADPSFGPIGPVLPFIQCPPPVVTVRPYDV